MKTHWFLVGAAGFATLLAVGAEARGDDDDHEEGRGSALSGVAPVTDATWSAECGSCHFAYQPGLLPGRSWEKLLGSLSAHFGEDAAVSDATLTGLRAYAAANAADQSPYALSVSLARASAGTTPDRISTLPALRREHLEEVPASFVTGNPEVRSWAN
jgi:hypothetical protein